MVSIAVLHNKLVYSAKLFVGLGSAPTVPQTIKLAKE